MPRIRGCHDVGTSSVRPFRGATRSTGPPAEQRPADLFPGCRPEPDCTVEPLGSHSCPSVFTLEAS